MLTLTSPAIEGTKELAQKYGKKGDNISPPLAWTRAPVGTRSFALALVDKHPVAKGYVHWLVVDIDPDVTALAEGAAEMMPDRANQLKPYVGPFPPAGTHVYEFTLYALDVGTLDLPSGVGLDRFSEAVHKHLLASTTLHVRFTKLETA